MTELLSTGMEVLDRKLDGGFPAGCTVVLSASPASQSELFLYEMATVRSTEYITTERSAAAVRQSLEGVGVSTDTVTVHRPPHDEVLEETKAVFEDLSSSSTVIIDPMHVLETYDSDEYRGLFNKIKARTAETESLTVLHCLDGEQIPPQRDRTQYLADIIFQLSTMLRGDSIENILSIPKFRSGRSLPEAIDLDLTADVTIDVSRRIA